VTGQRSRMIALLLVTLSFSLLMGLPVGAVAQDGGIGIFPVRVEITDALRGGTYLRTVTVVNRETVDFNLKFITQGEAAGWVTVHDEDDPDKVLQEVIAPAGVDTRFLLQIQVPDDASNGEHRGIVLFDGTPLETEGDDSGMGVSIGIGAEIVISVGGNQNLSGSVLGLSVDEAEAGRPPVRLRVQFQNAGNVEATPTINWQITDSAGTIMGDVSYSEAVVGPGLIEEIISEWDSTDVPEGAYTAFVSVLLNGEPIFQQEVPFGLLPVGTLTRSGTLESVSLEGEPVPGSVAKVLAAFTNSGKIDSLAVFAGEVYRDGQLIQTIESRERLVIVGELALLEAFFDVPEAGDYRVSGKVNYEGKETEVREVSFTVTAVAGSADSSSQSNAPAGATVQEPAAAGEQSPWIWITAGILAAIVAGGIAFAIGRRRGSPPPTVRPAEAPVQAQSSDGRWD
jgi:hypothetical protein